MAVSKTLKIWAAVATAVAVVGVIAVPNFIRPQTRSANPCVNNLRCLDGMKQQWQLENRKPDGSIVTWEDLRDFAPSSSLAQQAGWTNGKPTCPEGGTYILGRTGDGDPPKCTFGKWHALPH